MKKYHLIIILGFLLLSINVNIKACTNFLFTKGATKDGSTMITYVADSHVLYGELYYRPAMDYPEGAMFDVHEWDTDRFLGKIKQVRHTYSVIGNMNEFQVAVGETTYGGRSELQHQPTATMDYGSMMFIALQRAKTAREAIKIMVDLVANYGYCSEGESFSISDPNEVWIMEMIGKGKGEKGAVWVARKVPDGYICAHANQARITTFPLENKKNSISYDNIDKISNPDIDCVYASDVISFARKKGYYKGKDKDFSFSDTYAPVNFESARWCEARVWEMFRRVNKSMDKYKAYAEGNVIKDKNGYAKNRLPLWIKPDKKLSVHDVMELMRDHFEGTDLDMTKDIGAGPFKLPYRWRPLSWKVDSVEYCNERATSTQQTGFSFIAQGRSWIPNPIGGIFWFGIDDTYSNVYVPMYCGMTRVPESYAVGNGDMLTYSDNSAFWTFNLVSNLTYLKYNVMIKDVQKVQKKLENKFIAFTPAVDKAAAELYKTNKDLAREFITEYSCNQGNNTVRRWKKLAQYLLVKYKDGNVMKEKNGKFEKDKYGNPVYPSQPGYPEWWYKIIIEKTGDHFKMK